MWSGRSGEPLVCAVTYGLRAGSGGSGEGDQVTVVLGDPLWELGPRVM